MCAGLIDSGAWCSQGCDRNKSRLGRNVIAAEQIQSIELVSGHETLDLIENSERIERAQLWFEIVCREPDCMAVSLSGLCATRLTEVGSHSAFAEGHEGLDVGTHCAGEADKDFEVRFDSGAVGCFAGKLDVAEGIGYSACLLIKACGRKYNVGDCRGLGEKQILNDKEGFAEGSRNRCRASRSDLRPR